MSDTQASILRKMVSPPQTQKEDVPLTASRAVRLALTRAADDAHDLMVTVEKVTETVVELDVLSGALTDDLLLVELLQDSGLTGVIALDHDFKSAILEMQTIGFLLPNTPDERPATATDTVLVVPLLANFLQKLDSTTLHTDLGGWSNNVQVGARLESVRALSLALPDKTYRAIHAELKFGSEGRAGKLAVLLPITQSPAHEPLTAKQPADVWSQNLEDTIYSSHASLDAVLHKAQVPLSQVQNWSIGQVVPLLGCTVDSIQIVDSKGKTAATARLGQYAGLRAVRLQAHVPHMTDIAPPPPLTHIRNDP